MKFLKKRVETRLDNLAVPVSLTLPSGEQLGRPDAAVRLYLNDNRLLAPLLAGQMGALGEAVVEGRLRIEGSTRDVMTVVAGLVPAGLLDRRPGWGRQRHLHWLSRRRHTQARDAEQIQFHYDVSDDFYALWLDPRRVYSCAYYREPDFTLAQAQEAKLDLICRKLALQPGERFLDIGAGWGGLLLWAAENYGVDATGITLSKNQYAYVQQLIAQKGLQDRVRIYLKDYRDLDGGLPYDKIASIGMFEHVGRANLPGYFKTLYRLLKPAGLLMNHGITAGGVHNSQVGAGLGSFIGKYIFPGGELVHVSQVMHDMANSGLEAVDVENLRPHYARTLWDWSDALEASQSAAARVLEDSAGAEAGQRILRAYRLYLAGCALAFENGWVSLYQLLATRPSGRLDEGILPGAQSVYPYNRSYIYC
ncbi:MAG: class I SAM-dependent methyltransferase [Lautropia sp.]|nr:class I SAM-dependent methyltransferase [Lautropia sp.]